jgi:hypothetical protein
MHMDATVIYALSGMVQPTLRWDKCRAEFGASCLTDQMAHFKLQHPPSAQVV